MATETKRPACPECGDDGSIYALLYMKWNPSFQRWDLQPAFADTLQPECTACDHGSTMDGEPMDLDAAGFPPPDAAVVERVVAFDGEEALAAMCLWEAVVAPDMGDSAPWSEDRENEGTCFLRDRVLGMAKQCDADWAYAREHMEFDDPFDWEFAPAWLRHNYGKQLPTPAERRAWLG